MNPSFNNLTASFKEAVQDLHQIPKEFGFYPSAIITYSSNTTVRLYYTLKTSKVLTFEDILQIREFPIFVSEKDRNTVSIEVELHESNLDIEISNVYELFSILEIGLRDGFKAIR